MFVQVCGIVQGVSSEVLLVVYELTGDTLTLTIYLYPNTNRSLLITVSLLYSDLADHYAQTSCAYRVERVHLQLPRFKLKTCQLCDAFPAFN